LAAILGWWRSIYFESRHLFESAEFWIDQEARVRPRAFVASIIVFSVSVVVGVAGILAADSFLAGFVLGPASLGAIIVCVMWGKVP
jgi:hypothetical protein